MSSDWLSKDANRERYGKARRASWKEFQRETAMRDLFGDMATLEIEAKQRPAQHISEVVMKAVKGFDVKQKVGLSVLLDEWPELVGDAIASTAKPAVIDGTQLRIEVNHASAMFVFEHQMKDEILAKVQTVCKNIKSIRFIPAGRKI
jgi:hypothetical protein